MIPVLTALDFAAIDIDGTFPVREDPGRKNRSRRIDQLNVCVANALGAPYCAAGVSAAFFDALRFGAKGIRFPYSGSSQAIKRYFNDAGLLTYDASAMLEWQGALGGWTEANDPDHGHVFLVARRLELKGKIVKIGTAEYNTSARTKSRDGEGAYRLERGVDDTKFWYCNVSKFTGGAWWKPA